MGGCVLRLVEDDDGIAECASAHKGERSNLDNVLFHHILQLYGRYHVFQRIVERLEVWVNFVFHIARQETELFAGFYFNMSMLVWGWAVLGKKFALNTLASSVLSPAFLGLFERLLDGRVLTEDIFLCTIFSGLGIGVALGMVIRAGASTGGMDIPPLVLQKWFRWPVSITMMLFDIAILLVQAAFSQPEQVLYGIVLVITHTIVMDKMLMLGDSRTEVKIISTRSDEIRTAILAEIDRGVTVLHGEGGYTGEPSEVLLSVISNRELPRLEKLVHSIDPACFLIVSRVTEVSGRGFSMEKEYQ